MSEFDNNELFELTERLAQLGRGGRTEDATAAPDDDSPYARLVFAGHPLVADEHENKLAQWLATSLRRAATGGREVVYPRRLLDRYELRGIRLEPVASEPVLRGERLILAPEWLEGTRIAERGDRASREASRCLELYELAREGIAAPGRGLAGPAKLGGEWRLAWRSWAPDGSDHSVEVQVALRIELHQGMVTGRGTYLIGGKFSAPGYQGLRDRNDLVVELEHGDDRVVFWVMRPSLDVVIEAIHRQVAIEAIAGRRTGFTDRNRFGPGA